MRVLIINPNSSASVTARIATAAASVATAGDAFVTVTATASPALIVTPEDHARAVQAVLATVDAHPAPVDGIVLASFGDTALDEVRARVAVPVVGIARAAYAVAESLGPRFAVVSFSPLMAPSLRASIEHYGLAHRLAGLHTVDAPVHPDPGAIQEVLYERLRDLCQHAALQPGVGSIVLGGGPLAGLAQRLGGQVACPLIDGTAAAVSLLRVATLGASPAR